MKCTKLLSLTVETAHVLEDPIHALQLSGGTTASSCSSLLLLLLLLFRDLGDKKELLVEIVYVGIDLAQLK